MPESNVHSTALIYSSYELKKLLVLCNSYDGISATVFYIMDKYINDQNKFS